MPGLRHDSTLRRRQRIRAVVVVVCAGWVAAARVEGQPVLTGTERLTFDRPEAWGMKFAAAATTFGALDAPRESRRGEVELALEAGSVPRLSAADRRIGFNGTKQEDIDRTAAVGQLRLGLGLGHGLAFELSAVPPVELDGIEPRVFGAGLKAKIGETARLRAGARLAYDHGTLIGDITCSRADVAAGADPVRNPFGCEVPSDDRLEFDLVSAEVALSLRPRSGAGAEPYFSLAAHHLSGTFQVRASYQGLVDRTVLDTRGTYWSAALGVAKTLEHRFRVAGEISYASLSIRRPGKTAGDEPLPSLRLSVRRILR
jgi:hypothetical protein